MEPPVQGVRNFCMSPWGPIEKPKNENSDYVSIMVKMCSNEPQTNPMTLKIKLTHNFRPLASLLASDPYFQLKWPILCIWP